MQRVLVTGATGRTGALVLERLRRRPGDFEAFGFARSAPKAAEIFGGVDGFFFGDVTAPETLAPAFAGMEALVILTSSVLRRTAPPQPGERPSFDYPAGATPEIVDYLGQKAQIDAARVAGVDHIVLVGSMGGTIEDHPLNRLGGGDVLLWKRKAEAYLVQSGVAYTIIRPGGLIDRPGGRRALLVGRDDDFLRHPMAGVPPAIPRADVAEVAVQALLAPQARNKAFDLISRPEEQTIAPTTDFPALFAKTNPGL